MYVGKTWVLESLGKSCYCFQPSWEKRIPSLKLTCSLWKLVVGRRSFPFGEFPYFQVRTVRLRKVVIFVELRSKSSTRSIRDIPSSWQSFRFFSLEVTVRGKAKTQKGHPQNNNGPWSSGYKCLKKEPRNLGKMNPFWRSHIFNWVETSFPYGIPPGALDKTWGPVQIVLTWLCSNVLHDLWWVSWNYLDTYWYYIN